MKHVKLMLSAVCAFMAYSAAGQGFDDPKYAMWGETADERQENILNSNFLRDAVKNKKYDEAAQYLKPLLDKCPGAAESTFTNGTTVYKQKFARAKDAAEKKMFFDSVMLIYDLRVQYFGSHAQRGKVYILDRKAREALSLMPDDRATIRKTFCDAIEASGTAVSPETLALYFTNLCDDYKNTDDVTADEVIAEYDRLSPLFSDEPDAADFKSQFDAAFGMSGAASCENLEKLFGERLAADPDNVDLLSQAVALMSRAKCDSDFYFQTTEKYYAVKPSSETALFLAQAFQGRREYDKANKYLNEALAVEQDPAERQKLLVRISLVGLASNNISTAASAAREARDINPEDGVPYFVLGQCYGISAANCGGFDGQCAFWAAYDTMAKAVNLLPSDSEYLEPARSSMNSYRGSFPKLEDLHMSDMHAGSSYTVKCGLAAGTTTTVRAR